MLRLIIMLWTYRLRLLYLVSITIIVSQMFRVLRWSLSAKCQVEIKNDIT